MEPQQNVNEKNIITCKRLAREITPDSSAMNSIVGLFINVYNKIHCK